MKKRELDITGRLKRLLSISSRQRSDLYIDLSRGATLIDPMYWLQIIFSSGIATLGLVLNSPAVIIGAMLISPLMSPILSAGLALASGDMILAVRALTKIVLSCLLAVLFAVFLVVLLPFREVTTEILARTQPNTLDLFVALFSGTIGAVAVCQDVKGVTTSIPGVAVAVALMPPLCVAGYGLGLLLVLDTANGKQIASGGGLLLLTNFVAITFMAMVVFLTLRLNSRKLTPEIDEWERNDPESSMILHFIERFPTLSRAREVRSLPLRFLLIIVPLAAITVPLGRSFQQLNNEIASERQLNNVRKTATDLWESQFHNKPDGSLRSTIDRLTVSENGGRLRINVRVIDEEPFSQDDQRRYVQLLATQLGRPSETLNLRLTEIPSTSILSEMRKPQPPAEPSFAELASSLNYRLAMALDDIRIPDGIQPLDLRATVARSTSVRVEFTYLSDQKMDPQLTSSLAKRISDVLSDEAASINMLWIPTEIARIRFSGSSASLSIPAMLDLETVGRLMNTNPKLILLILLPDDVRRESRLQAISEYLTGHWQIGSERMTASVNASKRDVVLRFALQGAETR